jgi:hypothetical protein
VKWKNKSSGKIRTLYQGNSLDLEQDIIFPKYKPLAGLQIINILLSGNSQYV